jgi:hypothetical protein
MRTITIVKKTGDIANPDHHARALGNMNLNCQSFATWLMHFLTQQLSSTIAEVQWASMPMPRLTALSDGDEPSVK